MKSSRVLILILAVSLLLGCSGLQSAGPDLGCPTVKIELFFGLSIPGGGSISESDWKAFTASAITPRFPDGLTVNDARGQWRNSDGSLSREGTKIVVLIAENSKDDFRLIDEIREAYKSEFHQESVLLVNSCVNASF